MCGHQLSAASNLPQAPRLTVLRNSSGSFATLAAILRMPNYLRNIWQEEISPTAGMIRWPTIAMGNFVPPESRN
jgi:hypothetical protein